MRSWSSRLGRLGQAASLRPEARAFAARAWLGAPVVELSLTVVGLRRTLGWIDALGAGRLSPQRAAVSVSEGERLVRGAYQMHMVAGRCLSRSLVQYLLHRRDGTRARFVVGVRRPGAGRLEAHAWVEGLGAEPDPAFQKILVSEAESA